MSEYGEALDLKAHAITKSLNDIQAQSINYCYLSHGFLYRLIFNALDIFCAINPSHKRYIISAIPGHFPNNYENFYRFSKLRLPLPPLPPPPPPPPLPPPPPPPSSTSPTDCLLRIIGINA